MITYLIKKSDMNMDWLAQHDYQYRLQAYTSVFILEQ